MSWTDERVELLKKLWTDGLSASQIAGQLGGVTRNAVIGKVHRLSLSGRAGRLPAPRGRARCAPVDATPADLRQRQHRDEDPRAPGAAPPAGAGADRGHRRPDQPQRAAASAHRPDVQVADRRSERRWVPLLRPQELEQPALLRIPQPRRLPAGQRRATAGGCAPRASSRPTGHPA